jgi:hypothetical protein
VLDKAILSDDGRSIILTFDSDTDQGNFAVGGALDLYFPCGRLFHLIGPLYCLWKSSSQVLLSLKLSDISVNYPITLRPNVIRAHCRPTFDCRLYSYSNSSTVFLRAPNNPITPSASLLSSSLVSSCNDIILDTTASKGSAGRSWKEVGEILVKFIVFV